MAKAPETRHQELTGLFILISDLDALAKKGVTGTIASRTEGGWLRRAITLHPMAEKTRVVDVQAGLPVHELALPAPTRFRLWGWLRFCWHILVAVSYARRLIRQESVSFVRSQDPYFAGLIGYLATRYPRKPFAISIHSDYEQRHILDPQHGSPKVFGSRALAKRLEAFLLRRADLVLPIRDSLRRQAIAHGARAERATVLPHMVDFDALQRHPPGFPRDVEAFVAGRKVVLFAGRLSLENYVWDVLHAAERLAGRGDVAFVLAGAGTEYEAVRHACERSAALRSCVYLCGPVDQATVNSMQQAAYAGIVLMGGFTLIEFCAARCPSVTYDVEWHRELVVPGETGMLLPEGDKDRVVDALEALLDDPVMARQLGAAAYARAREKHHGAAVLEARRNLYRRLMTCANKRGS